MRERLANYTSFSAGRTLALELQPGSDIAEVRRNQRITTQAVRLISLRPDVTIGGAHDVGELARRAELGSTLDPSSILSVLDTLRAARVLGNAIVRTAQQRGGLDTLAFIAGGITPLPNIEAEIARCINEDGEVLDSASPALARIRAGIRVAHSRLMAKLQQIISSEAYSRALQEPIITLRGGRYVVPVKRDFQGSLRGVVHDQSNTGSTLFVEPLATVDLGNEWRQLQLEEAQEVERIMRELSALIGSRSDAIIANVGILADIDLALAKARYSLALDAVEPELVEKDQRPETSKWAQAQGSKSKEAPKLEPGILFKDARHPLLSGNVVPINVELGDSFRILVITGPNTGGKTVALKTVGLLTLMAQAGLHIPAGSGSRAIVFEDVFADIGDEQSIEQSLSTFSSHMSNIVRILKRARRDSLVLLDELGAGTDPQEGSALARSIITHLLEVGALAVCTTHYSELKAFAFDTPGVENASVEFDVDTLSPTYRLMIGVPGKSNAFSIANRLGLSHTIVDRAKRFIDPHAQNVEDLLENIRTEREAARTERGAAERARRDLERGHGELARHLAEIEDIKAQASQEARIQTEHELQALRDELRQLRGRVEAGLVATSDEALSRKWLNEAQARSMEMEKQLRAKAAQQEKASRARGHRAIAREQGAAEPRPLGPGDNVFVQNLGAEGEVLSGPDSSGQVEVQVGAFKMRVPVAGLQLRRTATQARQAASAASDVAGSIGRYAPSVPAVAPRLEYDFRGQRAEEAIEELDRRLNDAALVGMPFIRVIHGKGTGALRKAMRDFLKSHPLVKDIETPKPEEGGEGVTVVRL